MFADIRSVYQLHEGTMTCEHFLLCVRQHATATIG